MNLTLSIGEETLARTRSLAHRRGRSLNRIVQECLEELVSKDAAQAVTELERLWEEKKGGSSGGSWNREDAYDRAAFSAE
jgi:triphosphoribosyl-dephospho-CoA synthetase